VSGGTTTYTFFGHYEEEVTSGVTTAVSHYSFGGLRVAVKRGSTLYHVHGDHLGSASVTTAGSVVEGSRAYYPYGAQRSASGTLRTDRTFTGQKEDLTGLLYYHARYYDPALGTFISPDTLVPDPGRIIDYNRFLYARGNPLKYTDPSGYTSQDGQCDTQQCWEDEWYWKNRYYEAYGFGFNSRTGHWDIPIRPRFADSQIFIDTFKERAKLLLQVPLDTWLSIGTLSLSDITFHDISVAHDRWIADPIRRLLPENVVATMEAVDAFLAIPGVGDVLLASVGGSPLGSLDDAVYLLRLPARMGTGAKTTGLLVANHQEITIVSGRTGYASNIPQGTSGFNGVVRTHVEGHAAAFMRQNNVQNATLYINNVPCSRAGIGCHQMLPRMLPEGSSLRVVGPNNFSKTYVGLPD